MPTKTSEESLEKLLEETEKAVDTKQKLSAEADHAIIAEIEAIEGSKAAAELLIERDILDGEIDLSRKIEAELWNGAHIACLPFFYETYTIMARVEPELQEKYNKATIATCSRFKALGRNGLAMITPIVDFIQNYRSYSPQDRKDLDSLILSRILTWLREDIMPEATPRTHLTQSMEKVLSDIREAEEVFDRNPFDTSYMKTDEVQLAAVKAIRNSAFLPGLVKIRLLQTLGSLKTGDIYDIGSFLLWEIRKSSHHQNQLLYTMLNIFKALSSSLK